MASKTICIKDDVFDRLNDLKKQDESFSDLLVRILTEYESHQNNFNKLMKDVFGSGREMFNDAFLTEFRKIRKELNQNFEDQFKNRYD